jgi:hypothetical protein
MLLHTKKRTRTPSYGLFGFRHFLSNVGKTAKSDMDGCSIISAPDDLWKKLRGICVCLPCTYAHTKLRMIRLQ